MPAFLTVDKTGRVQALDKSRKTNYSHSAYKNKSFCLSYPQLNCRNSFPMIGLRDYFGFDFTANRKKIILKKDLRKYAVMKELRCQQNLRNSLLPNNINKVGPLSPKDATNAILSTVKSFLVATGCCQVNKLQKKLILHISLLVLNQFYCYLKMRPVSSKF